MLFIVRQFSGAFVATCTWNPSDKSLEMTLANSDLDALRVADESEHEGVRATASKATGKYYIEFKIVTMDHDDDCYVGFAGSGAVLDNNPATEVTTVRWRGGGAVVIGGASAGTLAYVVNSVLGLSLDFTNGKAWVNKDNGTWLGGGDPATDTTPTGTFTTGTYFPWHGTDNAPPSRLTNVRILAHAGNQTYSPPSGFTPFGD